MTKNVSCIGLITLCVFQVLSVLFAPDEVLAATRRVITTGAWTDTQIWEGNTLPSNGDSVVINTGAVVTVDQHVAINRGVYMENNSEIVLNGNNLEAANIYTQSSNTTIRGLGAVADTIKVGGIHQSCVYLGGITGNIHLSKNGSGTLEFSSGLIEISTIYIDGGEIKITSSNINLTGTDQYGISMMVRQNGLLTVNGGSLIAVGRITIGFSLSNGTGHFTGGAVQTPEMVLGWNATGSLSIEGGEHTFSTELMHVDAGKGTIQITNAAVHAGLVRNKSNAIGNTSLTVHLHDDANLITNKINLHSTELTGEHKTVVYLDGGTITAAQDGALIDTATGGGNNQSVELYVQGGGIINTNGYNVSIDQPLLNDPSYIPTPDGGIEKDGAGTLFLSTVSHSYSGPTVISTDTLALMVDDPFGSSQQMLIEGVLDLNGHDIELKNISGSGKIDNTHGTNAGSISFGSADGLDSLSIAISNSGANINLLKTGSDKTVVTSTLTHSGSTVIQSGQLEVNGAIVNSVTEVQSGAILSGTGSMNHVVVVDGIIRPGIEDTPGVLSARQMDFSTGSSSTLALSIMNDGSDVPVYDQLAVTDTLFLGGESMLEIDLANAQVVDTIYNLVTMGRLEGQFKQIAFKNNGLYHGHVVYKTNSIDLVINKGLLWLRADQGISDVGGRVDQWVNQALTNQVFSQSDDNSKPALQDIAVNYNNAVIFDGNGDLLTLNSGLFNNTTVDAVYTYIVQSVGNKARQTVFFEQGASGTIRYNHHPIWNGVTYYDVGQISPANGRISTPLSADSSFNVFGLISSTNSANEMGHNQLILKNGATLITKDQGVSFTGTGNNMYLGGDIGSNWFSGGIAEIMAFSDDLTLLEHQQVQTYLAIKYGISLDITSTAYVSSAGSTLFSNAGDNLNYRYNIAGIGRDDYFSLNQKQSRSQAQDGILAIGLDEITASNSTNLASFQNDQSFILWGSNGGTLDTTTLGIPLGSGYRMDRIWKLMAVQNVDSIVLEFDLSGTGLSASIIGSLLLAIDQDGDGNFSTGNIVYQPLTELKPQILSTARISLPVGSIFSIMPKGSAPGAVSSGLSIWLRSDQAVYDGNGDAVLNNGSIALWQDQSAENIDATAVDGTRPIWTKGQFNYYPSIGFDGATQALLLNKSDNDGMQFGTEDLTLFMVTKNNANSAGGILYSDQVCGLETFLISYAGTDGIALRSGEWGNEIDISASLTTNQIQLISIEKNASFIQITTNNDSSDVSLDNLNLDDDANHRWIGRRTNCTTPNYMNGELAEIIAYKGNLNSSDKEQIISYLSIKYGLSPTNGKLTNSTGVDIRSAHPGYNQDIIAIGRDDASSLAHYQSASQNGGAFLKLGINEWTNDNLGHAQNIPEDLSFFTVGSNRQGMSFSTSLAPEGYCQRLENSWQVQKSASWSSVNLGFEIVLDGLPEQYYLITSNDSSFAAISTIDKTPYYQDNTLFFDSVNLNHGSYFTLAHLSYDLGSTIDTTLCSPEQLVNLSALLPNDLPNDGLWWYTETRQSTDSMVSSGTWNSGETFTYQSNRYAGCSGDTLVVNISISKLGWGHQDIDTAVCSDAETFDFSLPYADNANPGVWFDATWNTPSNDNYALPDITTQSDTTLLFYHTRSDLTGCPQDTARLSLKVDRLYNVGTASTVEFCAGPGVVDLLMTQGGNPEAGGTWMYRGTAITASIQLDSMTYGSHEFVHYHFENGTCPADSQSLTLSIQPQLDVLTTEQSLICENLSSLNLSQFVVADSVDGIWLNSMNQIIDGDTISPQNLADVTGYYFVVDTSLSACFQDTATISLVPKSDQSTLPAEMHQICATPPYVLNLDSLAGHSIGVWESEQGIEMDATVLLNATTRLDVNLVLPATDGCILSTQTHQILFSAAGEQLDTLTLELAQSPVPNVLSQLWPEYLWQFIDKENNSALVGDTISTAELQPDSVYWFAAQYISGCATDTTIIRIALYEQCRQDTGIARDVCPIPTPISVYDLIGPELIGTKGNWVQGGAYFINDDKDSLLFSVADTMYELSFRTDSTSTCASADLTITVTTQIANAPVADLDTNICLNAIGSLDDALGSRYTNGSWFDLQGNYVNGVSFDKDTIIQLLYIVDHFCQHDTAIVDIEVLPMPEVSIEIDRSRVDIFGDPVATVLASADQGTVSWTALYPAIDSIITVPVNESNFFVYTTSGTNLCSLTDSIWVAADNQLEIPGAFTPDGDGVNDQFVIKNIGDYPDAEVRIFDRWGAEIFSGIGDDVFWDGNWNGQPVPVGAYVYMIKFGSDMAPESGVVHVVR